MVSGCQTPQHAPGRELASTCHLLTPCLCAIRASRQQGGNTLDGLQMLPPLPSEMMWQGWGGMGRVEEPPGPRQPHIKPLKSCVSLHKQGVIVR